MGVKTSTVYVCDCCGRESESSDFRDNTATGSSVIKIKGSEGFMAYNGDWGGANHNIEFLVCHNCSRKIRKFIGDIKSK